MPSMQSRGIGIDIIYMAVADDGQSLCRSFSQVLRTVGFQPVTYASAEALLQAVAIPGNWCWMQSTTMKTNYENAL